MIYYINVAEEDEVELLASMTERVTGMKFCPYEKTCSKPMKRVIYPNEFFDVIRMARDSGESISIKADEDCCLFRAIYTRLKKSVFHTDMLTHFGSRYIPDKWSFYSMCVLTNKDLANEEG